MNTKILKLITSTGLIIKNDNNNIYLFYDRHSGFLKNDETKKIYFLNNLYHDINNLRIVDVHKFFYYYPLKQEIRSLLYFFQLFLLNFTTY